MSASVARIRKELRAAGSAEGRDKGARFFKERVKMHGVGAAEVKKIAKKGLAALAAERCPKSDVFLLCDELWRSGYLEESFVACAWTGAQSAAFEPGDFELFEHWLGGCVDNWASCDTLCNHSIGDLLMMYPELAARLIGWTASPNRWLQRGAAVSLIIPARKGLFHKDVFAIAEALLSSPDDLVQKGYGWALKAVSEADPRSVFDYVTSRKSVMPRTAYRYALEKMPRELRAVAMKR